MAWSVHYSTGVSRRVARGFTLIEMMVVVVIVSVLAMLAVVGYRRLILSSEVSEATNMVQNIRVAQESYHSETQQYAPISAALGTAQPSLWYPQGTPVGATLTAWGGQCTGCNLDWSVLPLHVDGPVRFGYATTAGNAGSQPAWSFTVNGATMTLPTTSATDWYVVAATCDLDNNGPPNTSVYTTSWTNQVFVDKEGN